MKQLVLFAVLFFLSNSFVLAQNVQGQGSDQEKQAQMIKMQQSVQNRQDQLMQIQKKIQEQQEKMKQQKDEKSQNAQQNKDVFLRNGLDKSRDISSDIKNKKTSSKISPEQLENIRKNGIKPIKEETVRQMRIRSSKQSVQETENVVSEENSEEAEKETEQAQKEEKKKMKRFRAVEKDYTLPSTTFSGDLLKGVEVPVNPTFQVQTMSKAAKEIQRERTRFVECQEGDKNCAYYEVDDAGEVIWK